MPVVPQPHYTKKRYLTYLIASLISIILPFIRIDENHFFLLSFDHLKLHLFFIAFDMQELYLLPFVLILLFLFIFFVTTLGGRVWCAWSCPQTVFRVLYRDLIQTKLLKIRKNINNKQKSYPGHYARRALGALIFFFIALFASSNLLWYFVPPEDFFAYILSPGEHMLLLGFLLCISLFLSFDVIYLAENFCIYICPYARIQSVMFDHDTMQVIYDEARGGRIYQGSQRIPQKSPASQKTGECLACEACVSVCPTHIDIRRGMQLECINCLECADACAGVMARLGRPSLISWTSARVMDLRSEARAKFAGGGAVAAVGAGGGAGVGGGGAGAGTVAAAGAGGADEAKFKVRFLRFRTVGYFCVLALALAGFFITGAKKEHMLLNINRSSELYHSDAGGISNTYIFLFQNTSRARHEYYFELVDEGGARDERVQIIRPAKPFSLAPGAKTKQIVVLKMSQATAAKLAEKDERTIPLRIRAYATDEPGIQVWRASIFALPPRSTLGPGG